MHANTQSTRQGRVVHPKEGAGHHNYKVGENKYHGATANKEQLNCRTHT